MPEVRSVLRDGAFEAIVETASMAESYVRSLSEAAFRGDQATVRGHLEQLRLCCIAMIQTYNVYLEGKTDDENARRADGHGNSGAPHPPQRALRASAGEIER
ncbi:MAG TPA: hypothetical protein VGG68_15735 [Caulobacteraceae bacterium]|jgi:hypothetical protein